MHCQLATKGHKACTKLKEILSPTNYFSSILELIHHFHITYMPVDVAHTGSIHHSAPPTRDDEDSGTGRAPDLPPELHALILNQLEGENMVLKQCALTCKLYRHLAQKILLKSVVFEFSHYFNPADSFLEILEASPQIAHYATNLSICESGYPVRDTDQTQTQLDKSMPLVIPALVNLVDLVIGWEVFEFQFSYWKLSSQSTMMAKFENLVSLTLRCIIDVPLRIFNHLHRLEKFILDDVFFIDDPDVQAEQISSPCHIKHMKLTGAWLRHTGTIYPFLRKRRFGAGHLESLSLDMKRRAWEELSPTANFEAAKWLIRSNSESLKVLDVTISGNVPVILINDEPIFDLSRIPLLEEWSLGGAVCNTDIEDTGPIGLDWLARHLETIPTGKRFKSVIFRPTILGADGVMDDLLDLNGLKYFEGLIVDKILSTTEFFAIRFKVWDKGNIKPAKEQMQKHLPTLQSLGLLHFEEC
ncbi:hypothetical protein CPC08DRAFT_758926 [Agrocybe pediades]|nr:hypothetical protein CPC08DRAFT_758926 [Agrocybe pediades]